MGKFLSVAGVWFQGKKTILGGAIVMAAVVAGVWFQKVDAVTGLTIFGAGLSILGGAAKANRHQAELLTALQGIASAGADFSAGKKAKAIQDALGTVKALEPGAIAAAVPAATSALHISGATAEDVLKIAQSFSGQPGFFTIPSPLPETATIDGVTTYIANSAQPEVAAK